MDWPRVQLWSHTDTITADTDEKLLLGALRLMGSWVALEWKLLRGGRLWWQDWSWFWQGLCERLTLAELQMQGEWLSRRSCCSAVFVPLIAQLSGSSCVLGVLAGTLGCRGTLLTGQQKHSNLGRFFLRLRCCECTARILNVFEKPDTKVLFFFALVSMCFGCSVFFWHKVRLRSMTTWYFPISSLSCLPLLSFRTAQGGPAFLPRDKHLPLKPAAFEVLRWNLDFWAVLRVLWLETRDSLNVFLMQQ